jgi:hypothetical protein
MLIKRNLLKKKTNDLILKRLSLKGFILENSIQSLFQANLLSIFAASVMRKASVRAQPSWLSRVRASSFSLKPKLKRFGFFISTIELFFLIRWDENKALVTSNFRIRFFKLLEA